MYPSDSIHRLYRQYLTYPQVSTDTRSITPQSIFFALRGTQFDGNAFADEALEWGAALAVIDDARYRRDSRYVQVDDVGSTLQALAHFHRQQLQIPIIGITGSYGKTTTKELTQAVLRQRYKSYATPGNLNNAIGVPLSLLSIPPDAEIGVIEMGANHVGEIAALCQIAMPTHGLITSVGPVHLEGFGSFEGVMRGKAELYDYLKQHQGHLFINATDPHLRRMAGAVADPIYYLEPSGFYHSTLLEAAPYVVYTGEHGQRVATQLIGAHHFYNIAAALCIGKYFAVDAHQAHAAVAAYRPSNNRSQMIQQGSNTILLDAYNANPDAVKRALQAFQAIKATHKVLILGDMHELGSESHRFHREIVAMTTQAAYHTVILCGPHLALAQAENPQALYLDKVATASYLRARTFTNTAFLIKGSRSLQLETLVDCIHD